MGKFFGFRVLLALSGLLLLSDCQEPSEIPDKELGLEQELMLGSLLKEEISESSSTYGEIISQSANPGLYNYLYSLMDSIMASGQISRKDLLNWEPIILNFSANGGTPRYLAFSLPGGAHYYYSGILNYLDGEHQMLALMGKEMARNDAADPWDRLVSRYGDLVWEVIEGGNEALKQEMINDLISSGYQYPFELESDLNSVKYVCQSQYLAGGLAEIFLKGLQDSILVDSMIQPNPEILSQYFTFYPLDTQRADSIISTGGILGCGGDSTYTLRYRDFLDSLNSVL